MIPHNHPTLGAEEAAAVAAVLDSGWIAQGEMVRRFEDDVCRVVAVAPGLGVALSSGTAAIYLGLCVLGVSPGDEVIVPTYVCSAVLNAVTMVGATPAVVDVDPDDFNISARGAAAGRTARTRAAIVPHTFGVPADIPAIQRVLGCPVIENAASALGARISDRSVGTFGALAVLSFYASKVITSGTGGMLVSADSELIGRARDYREFDGVKDWRPRFNFQMSDLQAAVGVTQLGRLPELLRIRAELASRYREVAIRRGWRFQAPVTAGGVANHYRFVLRLESEAEAAMVMGHLKHRGITSIMPIERFELLHNYLKLPPERFPAAERIARSSVSLPIYPGLAAEGSIESVLRALAEL